ncbi:MAG: LPS export ABC transporter permease LptF [Deltaproteobacteria bacterium]|jgi:lipopolysaccharide export system permease protein|nr:LPS export ABC transporter permease LptF [Deltaproteobacteria bacterium]
MRPRIINRSIMTEILPSFLVNLLVFTFVLLMARLMSLTDLILNKGVGIWVILRIFSLILPKLLAFSVPMATLLSSLTTFLRMSADSELTVLKSSGLSLHQLLAPVLVFGALTAAATGVMNLYVTPKANSRFKVEILTLAKARADLAIKEQVFVRDFPGLTIYVGQLPGRSENMSNVVINDRRSDFENTVIVARRGVLDIDADEDLLLFRLYEGVIDRFYADRQSVDSIFFDVYELKVSPGSEFGDAGTASVGRQDMPTLDLLAHAETLAAEGRPYAQVYVMELHRRLSLTAAALLMAVIGMPLGASFRTRGRNFGLAVGLAIFVVYYSLFSMGWTLGETEVFPPFLAVWSPSIIALLVALWLLKGLNRTAARDPYLAAKRFWNRLRNNGNGKNNGVDNNNNAGKNDGQGAIIDKTDPGDPTAGPGRGEAGR